MNELFSGRFLRLVQRDRWEYAERVRVSGVVGIVAVTPDGKLILTEQFRIPVGLPTIELPAGLAGDSPGDEREALEEAAIRELFEETGFRAARMEYLTAGPSSAGLTSEVLTLFRAHELERVAPGGGDATEQIVVHEVPVAEVPAWLRQRADSGCLVDTKVFAALYFIGSSAPPSLSKRVRE